MNRRHLLQGLSLFVLSGKLLSSSPLYGQVSAVEESGSIRPGSIDGERLSWAL